VILPTLLNGLSWASKNFLHQRVSALLSRSISSGPEVAQLEVLPVPPLRGILQSRACDSASRPRLKGTLGVLVLGAALLRVPGATLLSTPPVQHQSDLHHQDAAHSMAVNVPLSKVILSVLLPGAAPLNALSMQRQSAGLQQNVSLFQHMSPVKGEAS